MKAHTPFKAPSVALLSLLCVIGQTRSATEAPVAPAAIPESLQAHAFDPEYPKQSYLGYEGGPGTNETGRYFNQRRINKHTLGLRYNNRAVSIYLKRADGKQLRIDVGAYRWPVKSKLIKMSVFATPDKDKIMIAVGGIPVAVLYPETMNATCISQVGEDDPFVWDAKALAAFKKPRPANKTQK